MDTNAQPNSKLYFLHLPKTAGTTLNHFLSRQFSPEKICPAYHLSELLRIPPEELAEYELFRGHFYFGLETFLPEVPDYITFIRFPVERVISTFHHVRRTPGHEMGPFAKTLESYVAKLEEKKLGNLQTTGLGLHLSRKIQDVQGMDAHLILECIKQHGNFKPSPSEMLSIAKFRLQSFKFVGITEKFEDSLKALCGIFSWKPPEKIERLNQSMNIDHCEISERLCSRILELNRLDLELWYFASQLFKAKFLRAPEKSNDYCRKLEPRVSRNIYLVKEESLKGGQTVKSSRLHLGKQFRI